MRTYYEEREREYYSSARELHPDSSLARERDVAPTLPPPRDLGIRFVRQEYPGKVFWQDHGQRKVAIGKSMSCVHCCLKARRAKIQCGMLGGRALGCGSRDG